MSHGVRRSLSSLSPFFSSLPLPPSYGELITLLENGATDTRRSRTHRELWTRMMRSPTHLLTTEKTTPRKRVAWQTFKLLLRLPKIRVCYPSLHKERVIEPVVRNGFRARLCREPASYTQDRVPDRNHTPDLASSSRIFYDVRLRTRYRCQLGQRVPFDIQVAWPWSHQSWICQ